MQRELSNKELENLYQRGDSVRIDAKGCEGCSYCCEHVGRSIVLDPYDLYQLTRAAGKSYEELLQEGYLEVHIVDGLMLPNLSMRGDAGCGFLNEERRCSIHEGRPGFCRLFPLARVYQNGGFSYIVQSGQCQRELDGERRIEDWIGVEEMEKYESFVLSWHDFRAELSGAIPGMSMRAQKMMGNYLLRKFYQTAFGDGDFFKEYRERLEIAGEAVKKLM